MPVAILVNSRGAATQAVSRGIRYYCQQLGRGCVKANVLLQTQLQLLKNTYASNTGRIFWKISVH